METENSDVCAAEVFACLSWQSSADVAVWRETAVEATEGGSRGGDDDAVSQAVTILS